MEQSGHHASPIEGVLALQIEDLPAIPPHCSPYFLDVEMETPKG